ncbi:HIT domain-containing protein [Insolitispirillum peregrinum]|uniref:Diadenosine tetraphosphate (Ap4A) hydrolase n=1 Tax=Insolitispirillum peregrinum TaxID=80876 RepID=A0A1N7Q5Z7_9PROT|nr:HIT family protein [Insolitispirillum peregrinum]SIT18310.1 Diadenosine tetraphosphate (Ap4A) hydrolase [Insolitispirillum peregrinum]
MFTLHPRLAADTIEVAVWPLCQVRLMNDRTYPWLILVPQRADLSELHQLAPDDRTRVMHEMALAGRLLSHATNADKINTAALGNMVPQLHIHVIARFKTDPAWPNPVWGHAPAEPYDQATLSHTLRMLRDAMTPPRPPVHKP